MNHFGSCATLHTVSKVRTVNVEGWAVLMDGLHSFTQIPQSHFQPLSVMELSGETLPVLRNGAREWASFQRMLCCWVGVRGAGFTHGLSASQTGTFRAEGGIIFLSHCGRSLDRDHFVFDYRGGETQAVGWEYIMGGDMIYSKVGKKQLMTPLPVVYRGFHLTCFNNKLLLFITVSTLRTTLSLKFSRLDSFMSTKQTERNVFRKRNV